MLRQFSLRISSPLKKKSTLENFYFNEKNISTFDNITYILLTGDKKGLFSSSQFQFFKVAPFKPFLLPFIMAILTLVLRRLS